MSCLVWCRNLEKMWSMKVVFSNYEKPRATGINHFHSSHQLPKESQGRVDPGSGKQCFYALSWGSKVWNIIADEINKDFLQKTCRYRRAQSGTFLVTSLQRITKFSVKKVNSGTMTDLPWWYNTWQHSGYNHTCVRQYFSGDLEEPHGVSGKETQRF